jgi:hypothetical protein
MAVLLKHRKAGAQAARLPLQLREGKMWGRSVRCVSCFIITWVPAL